MEVRSIAPETLHRLLASEEKVTLIDVRTPAEYRAAHVPQAHNLPLDQLSSEAISARLDETVYVICQGGGRSTKACQALLAAGRTQVVNVTGGTTAWEQAGYDVVRGQKTLSLERQVRIAAGALVLLGVVLGWLVHPAFYGLSAFVGAGLVFAGVTDTCGMGLLLARMPWNRTAGAPAPSCQTTSGQAASCPKP